ncbi:alpha-(1,3)-fucosyltransferase C-like isoform X2 [Biomphalaria glabrata]|uniref:Fucosyltransferase n=1 Tax=Biomphalaria glabrata TaxID=6526 RepID=A0A9W3BC43_BIOGL|nr:alpha-(1,3)-fucosyltransferase C-like isoform X2 [Biomphalaria glabrata]
MRQGQITKLLLFASFLCTVLIFWNFFDGDTDKVGRMAFNVTGFQCIKNEMVLKKAVDTKVLLFYRFPDFYDLKNMLGFKMFDNCDKKCEVTTDEKRFNEADVVVFYSHMYTVDRTPPQKVPGQKWVFFTVETHLYSENAHFGEPRWWNKFDWTMSYRYDSEFWHGYVRMRPRVTPLSEDVMERQRKNWKQKFANKTKLVAWFVSHCPTDSLREKYVEQLSKHIPVDIYGKCGTLKCEDRKECLKLLDNDYKFYLSFENSLCVDYVTEKLLNVLELNTLVPVVRGGANYDSLFPPNSVINVKDFPSPEKLAQYLKELASNEEEYIKKLQWVWQYEVLGPNLPFCHLCQALHAVGPISCVYENVYHWWSHNTCRKPQDV